MTQDLYYIDNTYFDSNYFVYTADAESIQISISNVTAVVGTIKESTISLSSEFTQTSTISHINGADLFAMTNAALAVEISLIRDNNIDLAGTFSSAIDASRIRYITSEEDANFSVTIDNLRVRFTEAAIDAAFSLAADVIKIAPSGEFVQAYGTWFSTIEVSVTISHIEGADLSAFTNTTLTASVSVARTTNIDSSSQFTQNTQPDRIRNFVANQQVIASLSVVNSRIISNSANLTSQATLVADNYRIVEFAAVQYAAFAPSVSCDAVKNTFAVLDSTATMSASATINKTLVSNLTSQFTQTVVIKKIINSSIGFNSAFTEVTSGFITNKRPRTPVVTGTPVFSNTIKKFGTHSIGLPISGYGTAASNYLTIPSSSDFANWGTIDFWIYIDTATNPNGGILGPISYGVNPPVASQWEVLIQPLTAGAYVQLNSKSTTGGTAQVNWGNARIQSRTWAHIHLTKSGSTVNCWVDGVLQTITSSGSLVATSYDTGANTLVIGKWSGSVYYPSYIDELQIRSDVIAGGIVPTSETVIEDQSPVQMMFHFNNDYVDDCIGTYRFNANLASISTQTSIVNRVAAGKANLTSTSNLTAVIGKLQKTSSALQSIASLSAPYLSFVNKRPRSMYLANTSSYAGFSTSIKKFGTGSFYQQWNGSSAPTYGYIPTTSDANKIQNIAANEDFIISVWINVSSLVSTPNGTHRMFVDAGSWQLGISGNVFGIGVPSFRYFNGTSLQTILLPENFLKANQFCNWKIARQNGVITFSFYNGDTSGGYAYYVTNTATYSGALTTSQSYIRTNFSTLGASVQYLYFDELFFAKGTSTIANYKPSGEIADGALSTTQFLYHFDSNFIDDTSGIQPASAVLQSTSTLSAQLPDRTRDQSANLQVTATELVAIGRIRPFVDLEVANFNLAVDGIVTKEARASLNSNSIVSAAITKNIGPITASLSSTVSLSATAEVTSGSVINLQVQAFELVANARIRAEVADLISQFSLSVTANKTREAAASLSCDVTVSTNAKKIISPVISLTTTSTLIASTERTVPFVSTEDSQFTISCTPKVTRTTKVTLASTGTLSAHLADRTRELNLNLIAFASELSVGERTRNIEANLVTTSSLAISINVITQTVKADLVATSSLTVTTDRIRDEISLIAFNSTMTVLAGKQVIASADLYCEGFELAIGRSIRLDNAENYRVPSENRYWKIPRDINLDDAITYRIPYEVRSWTIPTENNYYTIEFEDRSYKIKG